MLLSSAPLASRHQKKRRREGHEGRREGTKDEIRKEGRRSLIALSPLCLCFRKQDDSIEELSIVHPERGKSRPSNGATVRPLSRPDSDGTDMLRARRESSEQRAGVWLSIFRFPIPSPSPPSDILLAHSLIPPSFRRIRRIRPTEITTRDRGRGRMVKQIHNLVLTRSNAKEAFGFRIIGGKEQGLTFKVRSFALRMKHVLFYHKREIVRVK